MIGIFSVTAMLLVVNDKMHK